jgi:tight adherence protein B
VVTAGVVVAWAAVAVVAPASAVVVAASAAVVVGCLVAAALAVARRHTVRSRLARLGPGCPGRSWTPAAVDCLVADLDLPWPPHVVWRVWAGGGAVAVVAGLVVGGPLVALAGAAFAAVGPSAARRLGRDRPLRALDRAVPAALEAVARSLRSGSSLLHAIDDAAREAPGLLAADLATVTAAVRLGADLPASLDAWASRRSRPGVRLAVAALALAAETGGASARPVDGVAATLRERQAVDREVVALSAQARLSALVIGVAPLAFAAFAAATDPRTSTFLFHTPLGVACLSAGLALDAVGAWWMRALTRPAP